MKHVSQHPIQWKIIFADKVVLSSKEFTKRWLPWTIPGIIHDMPAWGGQCQHNGSLVTDINLERMQINEEIGLDCKRDNGMVVFFSFG